MSVGTLKISKELRKVLLKVIIGFGCAQLILGLIIVYIGFRLETRIGSHLPKSNSERSITVFLYVVAVGLITVTLSIIGIRMGLNLAYQPPINNLQNFYDLWITMNMISVILLICFVYTIQEISDSTIIFIKDVFVHGISNYMSDYSWKNTFDYFQSHLKCCGINKYTDWYDTPWISLTQLPQDDANLPKYCRADGQVILPIVPSSCCKPFLVDSFCYSDISQKLKIFEQQGSPVSPSHLYTKGCVLIISEIFSRYTLILSLMAILVSFIQIMMVVVGQYLYTSTRNSLLMGNPNDAAPGWLFGRGDCGYIGGRPLGYFIADDTIIFHEEYDVYQEDQDKKEKSKSNWIGWKRPSLKRTDHEECLVKDDVDEQCSIKERIKKKLAQFKRKKIISNVKDEDNEIRNTGSSTVEFMQHKTGYNNNKRQRYKNFLKFAKISKSLNQNKQITPIIDKMESNSDDDEGDNTEMNLPYEKNIIYAYPQDYELQRVEYQQNQFNYPKFKNKNDSDHIQKQSGAKNDDRKNLENKRERSHKKKITVEIYDDDEDENDNDQDNLSEILYDLGMSQLKNRK